MATINLASSTLVASFPGLNRANGSDQLELTATLFDLAGAPLEGATVEFMVSPVFRADVVGSTTESAPGVYEATFTSKDASIKNIALLVDGVEVALTAQVEMVESNDSFLVADPFVDNVGQLSGDLTISGQQITLKAEAKNSGAITEIIWNGQQLLNSLNKDRQLQTKVVKDNFGTANWAQLNESGAIRQAWAADSSSRYIGDAQDLRHLVTQTFLSYREPVDFNGLTLDCSGDILTKHIGMDYLGNPNIFRVDFQNDQYASNKLGATSWAVSLSLVQTFTRFYTFSPSAEVTEPTEGAINTATEVVDTTYMGGPIVANEDGTVAVGIFRPVSPDSGQLLSSFVRPQIAGAGNPKFTVNYCQLIDFEDSSASGGLSAGKHRMERFICVGTLEAVTNAFRELQYFFVTGLQNPGDPGDPPPPPSQSVDSIDITAAPASVTRNAPFSVSIRAVDFTGATVTDYNGSVSVSAPSNLGLAGTGQALFVSGEATFSNLALSGTGTGNLVFTTQTSLGPRTGTHLIGVENEVPAISSITPDTAPDSLNGVDIRIDGLGLVANSQAFFGNTPLTTSLVAPSGLPSYLEATIPGANLVESSTPYNVTVVNPAPGGGESNPLPFLVTDGTAPELVPNSESVSVSGSSAVITWQTNEESVSRVFWGLVGQAPTELTFSDPSGNVPYSINHSISLSNLLDLEDYQAIIATEDALGNANPSVAVVTWQVGDTEPPTITNVTVDSGSTNVTITASVDESCTVALTLSPAVTGSGVAYAANEQAPAVWSLAGLTPATAYTYTLIATDPSGNQSVPVSGTFTTDVAADTTPPDIINGPDVSVQGLSATVTWTLNEAATGSVYYRQQGQTGGYSTATSGQTGQALSATLLLPYYETVYEYYVAGADLAGNSYQSDTFTFATGPDLTGSGGGLDPNVNDLMSGEVLTRLKINVPAGLSAGDSFIAHATVPVSRPSDLNINWAVDGQVVQRHVNSYKPRAQGTSARYIHQLEGGQITHPATQVQAPNNVLPPNWAVTSGDLSWSGGNLVDPNSVSAIRYYSDLTEGIYELNLRADAAYNVNQYFHVRINGGAWQQAHGTSGTYGGYTDNSENTRISFTVGADEVGEYLVEIAGASFNTTLSWFALVPAGQTVSESVASTRLGLSDPTGPNSAEIVFPVTVPSSIGIFTAPDPQSSEDLKFFEYDLVATNAPVPAGTAQAGREIDQARLVMEMPKPAVDAGYDATMDAVIAGGAGTVTKSGPYMDEVVYYTRLTDVSGNAGVGVHSYVRYYKADVDDSVYLDLNITNSHVDTSRIALGMSENAYVGNPGKIFFDRLYLATNDANYNIINGFGAETVTTPDGGAMTVGDPYCGGPALGDDTTFFFVDYTDDPENEPTRSHDGTGGIAPRSEVFHAGAQRIEQVVLRPASSPVKSDLFATEVSQYQNVATTKVDSVNRNATQQLRWYGGNYYRSGDVPETYVGQSPFPATLVGSHAYDRMRMNNAAQAIKEIMSTGAIQANRDFFEQGGIIDWADQTQFGCWTPGGSVDGSSSKNHMLNVYETAGGPGHTRGWAFFARTVLQRHSITAFDAAGDPITIRHLYGTSAQAGATANESAIHVRNDRSGQAHGWSFFYERDEWVADRFYSRGTQVRYNGQDFVCLASHRASSPPTIGAVWAAGSENNTRANQREFNGTYPIVPEADIDAGAAYALDLSINCAYDTAWDQFTPISRDYIQRLYRCFLGLRLSVNPTIFNDYQRYQTELYLAAEDRFITQNVLNGGKTNDTLGHCLETFTGNNANRGFFHNDDFSDPGMQSDWGAGKAWSHWVIAQGLFFTAPEEIYPAPIVSGQAYNRRQHIKEHLTGVSQLIADVMPGESSGNITETYPASPASRRAYLNTRDDVPGFEDTQVVGLTFTLNQNGGGWSVTTLRNLVSSSEYGELQVYKRLNPFERVGYLVGVDESSTGDATLWIYLDGTISPSQGLVCVITDAAGNKLPQAEGYLLQVSGQEMDAREFSYAKTDDLHINTHMWQCLAESASGFSASAATDLFRLSVDHAQFDLEKSGTAQAPLNWATAEEVSGVGDGSYSQWTGLIAGTSTSFAGAYYPTPADLAPTSKDQTSLAIPSSIIPHNTTVASRPASRDGQPVNRIPAVTGGFVPKVSADWASLAWISAHYSTRRLSTTSDPDGLLSPYLRNSYLRTGLGYETEESSPLLTYDASGQLLTGGTEAQRALINSIVDPEERFAIKNRILAAYYAKDVAYENWYNTSPVMAEIDYQFRVSGADIAGIRLTHSGLSEGESSTPLILEAAPNQSTTVFPVTLSNTGIPSAEPTTVTLSLEVDPEATAPTTFPGPSRLRLASSDPVVIPANTTQFSTQIGLVINDGEQDLTNEPSQVGLLVASASGGTTESDQIPFILDYPTLEPSEVRFTTSSSSIQTGQTVTVQVSRNNSQQPVSVLVTSTGNDGFQITGLASNRLTFDTGVSVASFTVSYTQPPEGPGSLTLRLEEDPNEPYTVSEIADEHTITALVPVDPGESEIVVARLGAGDGSAGPAPGALGLAPGDFTLVSATVPLVPAQAALPQFSMALGAGTPYLADAFPVARNADGAITVAQVTCPVIAADNGKVKHAIVDDATNPSVILRRYGVGETVPGTVPDTQLNILDLTNVRVELTDSDAEVYTFDPNVASQRSSYSGNYTRQVEYYGPMTTTDDELLIVRMIVTERSDLDVAAVDIIVENSKLTCAANVGNQAAEVPNPEADGIVYFDSIKLVASDHVIGHGVPHPSQGTVSSDYFLVKPYNEMHANSSNHGILPGQWFARRVVLANAAVEANMVSAIANRDDWGFVEGGLGFVQGGFGPADEGIPMLSKVAGLSYGGETGFRAAIERANTDRAADIADFVGSNLPSTSALGGGAQQWASWGWFKGTSDSSTFKKPETVKPFGVNVPSWRAANSLMALVDRTIERSGFAAFNTLTGYPVRDTEYRADGQTPAAFNLFRNPALDINPWLWTNTAVPGLSTTTNWARAAESKQTDTSCAYLDTTGLVNWHENTDSLLDPINLAQTDRDVPYGPYRGSASSRILQAYIPAIYMLNDRVAKVLCEYDANKAMFGFARYNQRGGGISTSRSPFGAAQSTFGLLFLATDANSPYLDPANTDTNTGIVLKRQPNSSGGFDVRTAEIPGVEAWAGPALAIATAYLTGDGTTRQWVAPSSVRNWFSLMSTVIDKITSSAGVLGASVANAVEVGLPRYTDGASNPGSYMGELPGPQNGNGAITPVTAPTSLSSQTLVPGELDLTWEYPDVAEYPTPDQFVIVRNDVDVGTSVGTARTFSETGLGSQTPLTYKVRAEYGEASATSAPLEGVFADGSDGGTNNQPTYDGETDLPAGYYVPQTTFNYLIDVSGNTDLSTNSIKTAQLEFADRLGMPETATNHIRLNPRSDATPTRIAVLLPDRTETDAVSVSRDGRPADKAFFDLTGSNVEIHFVGPRTVAPGTPRTALASESRDNPAFAYGYIYDGTDPSFVPTTNPNSSVISDLEIDGTYEVAHVQYHLWNWDIRLDNPMKLGRTVDSVALLNRVYQEQDVYIHMSKITGGGGVDVELTRLQLEGVYIDLPSATGSAITMDAVPYGDMTWDRVDIVNSGGAGIQVRNSNAIDSVSGLRERIQSGTPGTITFTEWFSTQFAGDSPYAMLSFEGDHHAIEFSDNSNFIVTGTNTSPILRVFHDSTADTILGAPNSSGGFCSGVSISGTGVGFYSEDPTGGVIQIDSAASIVVGGRVSVGTSASNNRILIGTQGRGALDASAPIFSSLRFEVASAGITDNFLSINSLTGINNIAVEAGTNAENLGAASEVTEQYSNFVDPVWDVNALNPAVGGSTYYNALDLFNLGLTLEQYKDLIVPGLRAQRQATRTIIDGFQFNAWQMGYPNEPGGVQVKINNRTNPAEWPTWAQSAFNADRTVLTFENLYSDGRGVAQSQANIWGPYKGPMGNAGDESGRTGMEPPDIRFTRDSINGRPFDAELRIINSSWNGSYYGLSQPSRPKWGMRGYNIPRFILQDSDFGPIYKEHCIYVNTSDQGYVRMRGCTFYKPGGQGLQLQHRSDNYGPYPPHNAQYGENSEFTSSPDMLFEQSHFVDCGANPYGQRGSNSLTVQNSGYPELPGVMVVKDCTFVAGNEDAVPPTGSNWSTGGITSGIEGNRSNSTRILPRSYTQQKMAEANRDVGCIYASWTIDNCFFYYKNPDKALINLSSAEQITIKNTVINMDRSNSTDYALIDIDRNCVYDVPELYGKSAIFQNCRWQRNYTNGQTTTSTAKIAGKDRNGNAFIVTIDSCVGTEIEIALGNHPDVLSGAVQCGDVIYSGAIR